MTHPELSAPSKEGHPENSEPEKLPPVSFSSIPIGWHFETLGCIWQKTAEGRAELCGHNFSCLIAADQPCLIL